MRCQQKDMIQNNNSTRLFREYSDLSVPACRQNQSGTVRKWIAYNVKVRNLRGEQLNVKGNF